MMYTTKVIFQIGILFGLFYIGSYLKDLLHIPLPGSIIGLLLLLILLLLKILPIHWVQDGANVLITFLPLLLVPATVSVMNEPSLFSGKGVILFGIIIGSTIVTMISAGWGSQHLERIAKKRKENVRCNNSLSQ
ncbi:CidA/LrgA family holin-like protein [Robertmurraya korlensis]|uniref:CidA/LrgA family protein n=1 Tax=Robertmurraya korlensis TaxID=519977 RepID=UPI00203BE688|nr:CidA/LrgA family holin-like protein [Robertmurraya korlensis]MCM3602142.1 CidA/LrgA family holin-like protein [Robertmurraya korlensis]